jgi:tripartite-type tricarboxylate transporter receptor subunit TctC
MVDMLGTQGLDPVSSTPAQFDKLIRAEIDKWRKLVQATGIRVE